MKLRELGVGLAIVGATTAAGCSTGNPEMPAPTENSEAPVGALPCRGLLGKISVVNSDLLEFRVDEIKGSPECENKPDEVPPYVDIIQPGTFGAGKEYTTGSLAVGDTFRAVCDLGRPSVLLINFDLVHVGEKAGEGLLILAGENPPVEDLLVETGVAACNEEQLDRALGR